jgi:uncharacterized membrane protein
MVTVTGTSGSLIHSTIVRVTVTAPGSPDFDVTASPTSLSINPGDKGTTTITVAPKYSFSGTIALSASFSSPGLTAAFDPSSVSIGYGSGSSTMTINAGSSVAAGNYLVTVQASSGSLSHPVQVTITVTSQQSQQQTSSNPQNILGLAPIMFYGLAGGIAIVVIGGIGVAIRLRKPKLQ